MKNILTDSLLYVTILVIKFLAYQPWAFTALICVGFLIVSWINFSNYNANLYSLEIFIPILKWLGVEESGTYGNGDILALVSKVSFIFGALGIAIEILLKKVIKYEYRFKKRLGFIFVTVLFLFAVLSCFSGGAKAKGSTSIIPVLLYFWISAMGSYVLYLLLDSLTKVFLKVSDKALK